MKKLLIALLVLCLLPCAYAEEQSVHIHDLTGMTLLTQSSGAVPNSFRRLCPEADAVRCVTPEELFLQHGMSSVEVYAAPDGAAWVMVGEDVFRVTDSGSRLTSMCPVMLQYVSHWENGRGLIYTQQRGNETDVRCLDLRNGEITTLLTAEGGLVVALIRLEITYAGYTPLPGYSDMLLCTAQIAQADTSDPALTVTLEKVVGDVTWAGDAYGGYVYSAALHADGHAAVEYGGARAESLAAFAEVYRAMYPDHSLSDPAESICDRTYLTGAPAYGRLYEVNFSNKIFLWRDGEAHLLNDRVNTPYFIYGIDEAVLTDLNGDGTEELVCVFNAGSGMYRHIAAAYDPVSRKGRELYTSLLEKDADALSLRLENGLCQLYQGDTLLGTVTHNGLEPAAGFGLSNLLDLLGF